MSTYWWLERPQYLKFVLRELSSVFVAGVVLMTLVQIAALKAGPEAYARFQNFMRSPTVIVASIIGLLFVVFHTVTWFNLAPHAMPIRIHGKRVPDLMVAGPNFFLWVVVSAIVSWAVLR